MTAFFLRRQEVATKRATGSPDGHRLTESSITRSSQCPIACYPLSHPNCSMASLGLKQCRRDECSAFRTDGHSDLQSNVETFEQSAQLTQFWRAAGCDKGDMTSSGPGGEAPNRPRCLNSSMRLTR